MMDIMKADEIPLSLYVHWPWCVQKCPYCDFNSHKARPDLVVDYGRALLQDWNRQYATLAGGRRIASVFFGGGTPSLAPPEILAELIQHIDQVAGFAEDAEITLEANPGTVDLPHFKGYAAAGVNRLSLGVQSFDDGLLHNIGRIHDRQQVIQAIDMAHFVGFSRLNIDLMTGLPSQTLEQALYDIETAIAIHPEHLSLYQLTLEPNTPFFMRPPADLPDEDKADDLQQAVHECAIRAGYGRYEVSAWATSPSARSRHNLNYWQFGDYLGIGAGAHGKVTLADGKVWRTSSHKVPQVYLQDMQKLTALSSSLAYLNIQAIAIEDLPFEFLLNALRLQEGVSRTLFEARTGLSLSVLASDWSFLVKEGLLQAMDQRLVTTPEGYRHLNAVLSRWLS